MSGCTGTDVTVVLAGNRIDPEQGTAEHPVDTGIVIATRNVSWSANPVCTLRPLASDLNVTKRGRCITTS